LRTPIVTALAVFTTLLPPASMRTVFSMTKKLLALEMPSHDDKEAHLAYLNTSTRYIAIKEKQAQKCKEELLILWTDYFKPVHLDRFPELHDTFWKAAK